MKKQEVEIYCDETNKAIVRMPNRKFPGYVIQGDNLSNLYRLGKDIHERTQKLGDTQLKDDSETLHRILDKMIRHYEAVLDAHQLPIPYAPDVVLKDILDWQKKSDT